jgi:hypothetical protein
MFQERIAKFNATIAVRRALTFCRRSVGAGTLRRSEGLAGHILKICKGHRHAARSCCPVFDQLHPKIYAAAVGLVAWFVVSAWVFFDREGQIGLSLAFVSVLLLIAVLLPWSLSLVWKRHHEQAEAQTTKTSFRDWRTGDFAVWGARLHGTHAAIDVLLPLAAVAFGLTAIGSVFAIVAATSP